MRLIALLSWYEESPGFLGELVESMARAGIDHVVAVDGAYVAYPDAQGSSGREQADAIVTAADRFRMGVTVHQPGRPWTGNEIEKRTFLFAAGHLAAEPGDWLWVCDGDEVITHADQVKATLAATDLDVASPILWEGVTSGEHQWNSQPIRKLFRYQPSGIRVVGHHACYWTGDGAVLWDAWQPANELLSLPLPGVKVRHRPGDRAPDRNRDRLAYYERSKAEHLEKTSP